MTGAMRSAPFRSILLMGVSLLALSTCVAVPAWTHGSAAPIPLGSPAFAAQWNAIEPKAPNFWGPAYQNIFPEQYQEATNGQRFVQYFDKARMEQTTAGGPVTNGLLTVELISGQRQFGDTAFTAFPPSSLPVVGDLTNTWPPYAALSGGVFAARTSKNGEPTGTVYKPDGSFGLNPGLAADPGAAYGGYQADPGGKYAHNIPLAFWSYLNDLPIPWLGAMGFPLTEPFWVNVQVNALPTWVLAQPFERRVLSYTPTNPDAYKVEMGNIGQHYYQWRYLTGTATTDDAAITMTAGATNTTGTIGTTGTPRPSATAALSATPGALAITAVQLGTVTDTSFDLTFKTSMAATSEILYGTTSHSYPFRQEISTAATQEHSVTLTDLQPRTKYFFALRANAEAASIERKEDYFSTASAGGITPPAPTATATEKPTKTPTPTNSPKPPSATPTNTPQSTSTATTTVTKSVHLTLVQMVVGAGAPSQLAASLINLEGATAAITCVADGASNTASGTAHLTIWARDPASATASSSNAAALSVTDRQTAVSLTATVTIPFVDTTTPPLTVAFSRKVLSSDYASGITITSPPLSNARTPGYNVTLTFSLALV